MPEQTPMMAQYLEAKEECRGAVLFFRLGDFYEMFNEDAVEVSRLLNLTLTSRMGHPMCGVPYHSSRAYIARLLRLGKKVAICEQVSVPSSGRGLFERKITEIITPGTAVEDDYLEKNANNFLAALYLDEGGQLALACIDASTGEFLATSFPEEEGAERLRKELGQLSPREVIVQQSLLSEKADIAQVFEGYPSLVKNTYPDWSFNKEAAYKRLCAAFSVASLQAFSLSESSPEVAAAGILIEYLEKTAAAPLRHIDGIKVYGEGDFLSIDDTTRKSLEIDRNLQDSGTDFTLFSVMNETRTAMGARTLRSWLLRPLVKKEEILLRLDATEKLYRRQDVLAKIRADLSSILDVERLAGRVSMGKANGKDLLALKQSMASFLSLSQRLEEEIPEVSFFSPEWKACAEDVFVAIDLSILEDCPVTTNEGGLIKEGFSPELDSLRSLRDNSRAVLEAYLEEEKAATGIANLKVKYNRLLGYYLEVTKASLKAVPAHFIRRGSVANAERFTTERLATLEAELNGAHARIIECETRLFLEVRSKVAARTKELLRIAQGIAKIDALHSFAFAAALHGWNKPEITDTGELCIEEGRHPVVEAHFPDGEFVPNGLRLFSAPLASALSGDLSFLDPPPASESPPQAPSFALITGPNMAGKSTFLRQTALIVLMAQAGSFVPAASALITPADKIFCRVGASDNLARGESTFLVEMTETAHILRSASSASLVIMDEVGRGTSTEDGLAIARAAAEYLLERIGCKTLFATHYRELGELSHPRLAAFCLDVLEAEGEVVFLKKVVPGVSASSYGVHVARLAGLPASAIRRAEELLAEYRALHGGEPSLAKGEKKGQGVPKPALKNEPALFADEEIILSEILSLDVENTTPMQALRLVERWKKTLLPR